MNFSELSITVITNVLLISIFIGIFFFTYATYIEQEVVKSQMDFLSKNITSFVLFLGPDLRDKYKNYLKDVKITGFDDIDKQVEELNKETVNKAIIANVIFFVCAVAIVFFIYHRSLKNREPIHLGQILTQNLIILLFVGLTEFSFLTFFGSKFISLNPNVVKRELVRNFRELVS